MAKNAPRRRKPGLAERIAGALDECARRIFARRWVPAPVRVRRRSR